MIWGFSEILPCPALDVLMLLWTLVCAWGLCA